MTLDIPNEAMDNALVHWNGTCNQNSKAALEEAGAEVAYCKYFLTIATGLDIPRPEGLPSINRNAKAAARHPESAVTNFTNRLQRTLARR